MVFLICSFDSPSVYHPNARLSVIGFETGLFAWNDCYSFCTKCVGVGVSCPSVYHPNARLCHRF